MAKKNYWLGILAFVLIIGMTVVGCDDSTGEGGNVSDDFVPVTDIINVLDEIAIGSDFTLSGTIMPANATSKTISWSVKSANGTGASINGNTLSVTDYGDDYGHFTITATIDGGINSGTFTKDFTIWASQYNNSTKTLYLTGNDDGSSGSSLRIKDFGLGQLKKETAYKITIVGKLDKSASSSSLNIYADAPEESIWDWMPLAIGAGTTDNGNIETGDINFVYVTYTEDDNNVTQYGKNAFIFVVFFGLSGGTGGAKISNFAMSIQEQEM